MFGLYPKKGAIAAGSDADILVYDPNRKRTISAATHHMDVDYSIFEGFVVQGASDVVMSRGTVVVRNGAWLGPAGHGRFLPRGVTDHARIS
jgi:dihydropyrimidinase